MILACQYKNVCTYTIIFLQEEIGQYLLEHNADPNAINDDGCSAILYCCLEGLEIMTQKLLEKKINVIIKTGHIYCQTLNCFFDLTPIEASCINGNIKIFNMLLSSVNNPNDIINNEYNNIHPLYLSIKFGHLDILKLLITKDNIDMMTIDGNTPLLIACQSGQPDIALYLIENGADIYLKNDKIETPLMIACFNKLNSVVLKLLSMYDNDMDVNIQNEDDTTALMFAVRTDNYELVKALINEGALVSLTDKNGFTAIDMSMSSKVTNVLRNRYNEEKKKLLKHEPLRFRKSITSSNTSTKIDTIRESESTSSSSLPVPPKEPVPTKKRPQLRIITQT